MNNRYPELAPAQAWQLAYQWLCQRRRHYPANADIWHLRFHWPARSATLFARVMAGHYRLSPMQLLGGHAIWSAEDALVLKWVALRVAPRLPWHPACEHGRGMGVVASRRRLHDFLQGAGGSHPYVLRTDIRGYYQHIDRARVLSRLVAPLPCPVCRELMRQYLYYSVECGGEFHTPSSGISRGCALSPLIGASLLWHIDADFAARGSSITPAIWTTLSCWPAPAGACAMPCAVSMAIWPPTALASTPPRPGLAAWIAASTGWGAGIPRRDGSASPPMPCNVIEPSPCGFMSRPCVPATRKPSANAGCGGILCGGDKPDDRMIDVGACNRRYPAAAPPCRPTTKRTDRGTPRMTENHRTTHYEAEQIRTRLRGTPPKKVSRGAVAACALALALATYPGLTAAFTGITVINNNSYPHGVFTVIRSLDTTSTLPNLCAGVSGCDLRVYAMSDQWGPGDKDGYESVDLDASWGFCLEDDKNNTLGEVATCLERNHVDTARTAQDYLPTWESVDDHALACLAYGRGQKYDAAKGRVHCAPIGGPLSTCKFDAPSLSGTFHGTAGVIRRAEVTLGSVTVECDADITLVAAVSGGPGGGTIAMKQDGQGDAKNIATVDLGAGEGEAITIKAKQGVKQRIDVKAYVSGEYQAGEVRGTGVIAIATP